MCFAIRNFSIFVEGIWKRKNDLQRGLSERNSLVKPNIIENSAHQFSPLLEDGF